MKKLILLALFISSAYATPIKYCGKPVPNIVHENNIHILLQNGNNKPMEVVVASVETSKDLLKKMNKLESYFICLEGDLTLENNVHILKNISKTRFY